MEVKLLLFFFWIYKVYMVLLDVYTRTLHFASYITNNKALVFAGELLRSAGVRGNQDEVLLSATGRKVAAVLFLQIRYQILW